MEKAGGWVVQRGTAARLVSRRPRPGVQPGCAAREDGTRGRLPRPCQTTRVEAGAAHPPRPHPRPRAPRPRARLITQRSPPASCSRAGALRAHRAHLSALCGGRGLHALPPVWAVQRCGGAAVDRRLRGCVRACASAALGLRCWLFGLQRGARTAVDGRPRGCAPPRRLLVWPVARARQALLACAAAPEPAVGLPAALQAPHPPPTRLTCPLTRTQARATPLATCRRCTRTSAWWCWALWP